MVFVFLSIITFLCLMATRGRKNSLLPSIVILLLYIFTFTFRSMNVADTEPYKEMFLYGSDYYEQGYIQLGNFLRESGFSFRGFLFAVAVIDVGIWAICTKKYINQKNLLYPIFFFFTYTGASDYGIVMRAGLADTFMYIVITYMLINYDKLPLCSRQPGRSQLFTSIFSLQSLWIFLIFVVGISISILFHQSAFVFVVVLLLYFMPLNNKIRYALLFSSLVIYLIPSVFTSLTGWIMPILEMEEIRFAGRMENKAGEAVLGLNQFFIVIMGVIYTYYTKYLKGNRYVYLQYSFILNIFIVGIVLAAMFSYITAGVRLGYMLIFFNFLLPTMLMKNMSDSQEKRRVFVVLIGIVVVNVVRLLISVSTVSEWGFEWN